MNYLSTVHKKLNSLKVKKLSKALQTTEVNLNPIIHAINNCLFRTRIRSKIAIEIIKDFLNGKTPKITPENFSTINEAFSGIEKELNTIVHSVEYREPPASALNLTWYLSTLWNKLSFFRPKKPLATHKSLKLNLDLYAIRELRQSASKINSNLRMIRHTIQILAMGDAPKITLSDFTHNSLWETLLSTENEIDAINYYVTHPSHKISICKNNGKR